MNKSKGKKHRLRLVKIIVLLPITIFVWMVGWILYVIGDQRRSTEKSHQKIITLLHEKDHEEENLREPSQQKVVA